MTSSTQTPQATDLILPLLDWLATEPPNSPSKALANMLRLGVIGLIGALADIHGPRSIPFLTALLKAHRDTAEG